MSVSTIAISKDADTPEVRERVRELVLPILRSEPRGWKLHEIRWVLLVRGFTPGLSTIQEELTELVNGHQVDVRAEQGSPDDSSNLVYEAR